MEEAGVVIFAGDIGGTKTDLALKTCATGGIHVAGGIAPKMLAAIEDLAFIASFADKGRMWTPLSAILIRVATSNIVNLVGAAHCARLEHAASG
jgi:glucokinase